MRAQTAQACRVLFPREMLVIAGAMAMIVAAWAWVNPVFAGAPDENAHTGLVQHVAETGRYDGGTRPGYASTEQAAAIAFSRSDFVTANASQRPPYDAAVYEAWLAQPFSAAARGDAAGPNPAAANPPVYYHLAAVPFRLTEGADLFTRVVVTRLLGLAFGFALVLAGWHLAAELLPSGPGRVVATAVIGLMPMIGFIEGSVSPDALMYPLWALVLLAGVKALRDRPTWVVAMVAGILAAVLVKSQSLALVPGGLVVVGVLAHRRLGWPGSGRARLAVATAAALGAVCLLVLAAQQGWLGQQAEDVLRERADGQPLSSRLREYTSYLWQFYLPRPSFLTEVPIPEHVTFWETVFRQYTGAFGWHEIKLPEWIYIAIAVVTVGLVAGALRALIVARALRRLGAVMTFLLVVCVALALSLHWTDYTLIKQNGQAFLQGRYFLPINPVFGLVAGAAVCCGFQGRQRLRDGVAGGLVAGLVLLNVISFGAVLGRFYA